MADARIQYQKRDIRTGHRARNRNRTTKDDDHSDDRVSVQGIALCLYCISIFAATHWSILFFIMRWSFIFDGMDEKKGKKKVKSES